MALLRDPKGPRMRRRLRILCIGRPARVTAWRSRARPSNLIPLPWARFQSSSRIHRPLIPPSPPVNPPQSESLRGPPIPPPPAESLLDPEKAARTDLLPSISPQRSLYPLLHRLFAVRQRLLLARFQSYHQPPLPSHQSMFSARKRPTCRHGRGIVVQTRSLHHRIPPINDPSCHRKTMERRTETHHARLRGVSMDKDLPWRQSRR